MRNLGSLVTSVWICSIPTWQKLQIKCLEIIFEAILGAKTYNTTLQPCTINFMTHSAVFIALPHIPKADKPALFYTKSHSFVHKNKLQTELYMLIFRMAKSGSHITNQHHNWTVRCILLHSTVIYAVHNMQALTHLYRFNMLLVLPYSCTWHI